MALGIQDRVAHPVDPVPVVFRLHLPEREGHPERADLVRGVGRAKERLAGTKKVLATEAAPTETFEANVTDPDSRIMSTKQGWVQGYNVEAAVNEDQVVIAYAATQDHNDQTSSSR